MRGGSDGLRGVGFGVGSDGFVGAGIGNGSGVGVDEGVGKGVAGGGFGALVAVGCGDGGGTVGADGGVTVGTIFKSVKLSAETCRESPKPTAQTSETKSALKPKIVLLLIKKFP